MDKKRIYIDPTCYESLMDFMNERQTDDLHGEIPDLDVFYNDGWLQDSAVIDNITPKCGNWQVSLVFAYTKFPVKFIKRKITVCTTRKRAKITADYMRRLAAKDQRGTLKVQEKDFKHCLN